MMGKLRLRLGTAAVLAVLSAPAFAAVNVIQNGDFTFTTGGTNGQLGFGGFSADNWTTPGAPTQSYTFLYNSVSQAESGSVGINGNVALWGPDNNPGQSPALSESPNGGNFIAADPVFRFPGPIEQDVMLVAGQEYTISFDWAAAQQYGYTGATNAGWTVSVGGVDLGTVDQSIANHGFSGWQSASFSFVATGGSEVVSFLSYCDPTGPGCAQAVPPFALLDSVSLMAVPEPSTWAMMALGFAGLGYAGFRSRRRAAISIV